MYTTLGNLKTKLADWESFFVLSSLEKRYKEMGEPITKILKSLTHCILDLPMQI